MVIVYSGPYLLDEGGSDIDISFLIVLQKKALLFLLNKSD